MLFRSFGFNGSLAIADQTIADKLEGKYFSILDEWVERGGKANEFQDIVHTCEKLVMVATNASEKIAFTTTEKERFDYRVDVCAKTTAHRVRFQPEFGDPKIVRSICDDNDVDLLKKLCRRSGLR